MGAYALPGTEQFLLRREEGGQPYRIMVAAPTQKPPSQGYPVLYALDANALFGTLVEALRVQSRRPEKTGVLPAVVVGIGYPHDCPFDESRFCDFTMPTPREVLESLPVRTPGQPWPETGGADAFRRFIESRLKPRIERDYPIDRSRQAILGHSLGGLFVLQTLLTQPHTFHSYIAGSPSVHWNKRLIEEQAAGLEACLPRFGGALKLLITVGELEKDHPSGMNANARVLYERLSSLAGKGLHTDFVEFAGEGHVSVLPGLASRALRFALGE
ncbi:BesA [Paenibacillus mucilaginosus 3016]|uniref:BesA n=1 Tax=Paenibacillus mucilaginosus 3016 TaxID=1116391 RepID=H6NJY7_9BACL|nr:alpha/beta hydrolase-fold protein [Paenibacillus mucilaginosus]AFC30840.1 BesA [Paenibacillus mucilaginosus 3016]WFA19444.1 alpha/beta hydrolase [Paenibacillus mucilaginosus]